MRIEADARTPGFTVAPAIRLGFARRELLFLAAGPAPFTLAAGRTGLADAYLPTESLMTQAAGPVALASVQGGAARIALLDVRDAGASGRRRALWAVLLLATGVLAILAWTLFRRTADAPKPAVD